MQIPFNGVSFLSFIVLAFFLTHFSRCEDDECTKPFDLVIIIDESGSIGWGNFYDHIKPFVQDLLFTGMFNISDDQVRAGVMTYSTVSASSRLYCSSYNRPNQYIIHDLDGDLATMEQDVAEMRYHQGSTPTGHALARGLEMVKEKGRPEFMTFFMLFTDGSPTCDIYDYSYGDDTRGYAKEMAIKVKEWGIILVIVQINYPVSGGNLNTLMASTNPQTGEKYVFDVENFEDLHEILTDLQSISCSYTVECSLDCHHGFCNQITLECECSKGWEGDDCNSPICELDPCPDDVCDPCQEHATCTLPSQCTCNETEGWKGINTKCEPICSPECSTLSDHSTCTAPWTCECDDTFENNPNGDPDGFECVPICDPECPDTSECMEGTNNNHYCQCKTGYSLIDDICEPICEDEYECGKYAECTAPATCNCTTGYGGSPFLNVGNGECDPICDNPTESGCGIHAHCVSPSNCTCDEGYRPGDPNDECYPICFCHANANCTAPYTCVCLEGYEGDGYNCEATCDEGVCGNNSICTDVPNVCECLDGYEPLNGKTANDGCVPLCEGDYACVDNANCVGPDVCQCESGYYGDPYNECYPICLPICGSYATCVSPYVCECTEGYAENPYEEGECIPLCDPECPVEAECVEVNECLCNDGYDTIINGDEFICSPICSFSCGTNAHCSNPEECECNDGYSGDPYLYCSPTCSPPCTENAVCVDIDVCECKSGYQINDDNECEPVCEVECAENAYCSAPNVCTCVPTFYFGNGFTTCDAGCDHLILSGGCPQPGSECAGRQKCICSDGYTADNEEDEDMGLCYSVCDSTNCVENAHCVSEGICECDEGYEGDGKISCNYTCSEGLCGDNSHCVNVDQCQCDEGYEGSPYDGCIPSCSPKCVENAKCVSPNQCECIDLYNGTGTEECTPLCLSGCGTNAECSGPNQCSCPTGYTGNPYVLCTLGCVTPPCGTNAKCVGENNCSCLSGYTGNPYSYCSPYCIQTCGTNAKCTSPNICECNTGYEGDAYVGCTKKCFPDCADNAYCNEVLGTCSCNAGYTYNEDETECLITCDPECAENAECTAPNRICECKDGYYGNALKLCVPYCGIYGCGDNAECQNEKSCVCLDGFIGSDPYIEGCSPYCPSGCPINSECIGNDVCKCISGYDGENCDVIVYTCNNQSIDVACNYPNGTCTGWDTCKCGDDYYGDNCEKWDCFLFDKDDVETCGENGECIAPNVCYCNSSDYDLNIVDARCDDLLYVEGNYEKSKTVENYTAATVVGILMSVIVGVCIILFISSITFCIVSWLIGRNKKKVSPKTQMNNQNDGSTTTSGDTEALDDDDDEDEEIFQNSSASDVDFENMDMDSDGEDEGDKSGGNKDKEKEKEEKPIEEMKEMEEMEMEEMDMKEMDMEEESDEKIEDKE